MLVEQRNTGWHRNVRINKADGVTPFARQSPPLYQSGLSSLSG